MTNPTTAMADLTARAAYAEALGTGQGVAEYSGAATAAAEIAALADEIVARIGG